MFISESFVYLCDFHREQSWDRWLKASHNCIGNDKPEILNLFRSIAHANTIEEFNMAKSALEVIKLMHAFNELIILIKNSGYVQFSVNFNFYMMSP